MREWRDHLCGVLGYQVGEESVRDVFRALIAAGKCRVVKEHRQALDGRFRQFVTYVPEA